MSKILDKEQAITGQWLVGHVVQIDSQPTSVTSGGLTVLAHRAAGCLIEPQNGDVVACIRVAPAEVWIISVLSRESSSATVLSFEGNAELRVNKGELFLKAESLNLAAEEMTVRANQANIAMQSTNLVSNDLRITSTSVKMVTSLFSSVAQRMTQFCKSYLRTTDGMDKVTANHVEVQAKQIMRLDAEHALVTGKQLVKARGAQIHFG
jgi:hypothetical protein